MMHLASWSRLLTFGSALFAHTPGHNKKQARSPVGLECLEDRTVPSASMGFNLLGPANNPTVNFNVPTAGLNVAPEPGQAIGSTAFPNTAFSVLGQQANGVGGLLVGSAAVNSLGLADQSVRLFASSAVNSLGLFNQVVPTFVPDVYGFGSGTQPGAPWAPAAYVIGLANQQATYPSIADMGFQSTPPWARNLTHKKFDENPPAEDGQAQPGEFVQSEDLDESETAPSRSYRAVSPEQVLDETEDQHEREEKRPEAALRRYVPPGAFGYQRPPSAPQRQDPAFADPKRGHANYATQVGIPVSSLTEDVAAPTPLRQDIDFSQADRDDPGPINLDGEKHFPNLEAMSLTEFPTLSRIFLLPSLSALFMEFPPPTLSIDPGADPRVSSRLQAQLPTNPQPEE